MDPGGAPYGNEPGIPILTGQDETAPRQELTESHWTTMTSKNQVDKSTLLIWSPDQPGLVAAVCQFLHTHGGNILDLDQYVDPASNRFFMRVTWDISKFDLDHAEFQTRFARDLAEPKNMQWELHASTFRPRMAIFVSKRSHCLHDILSRLETGEWNVDVPVIVSNHADLEPVARRHGIRFEQFDIESDHKADESKQIALMKDLKIDLIVLARYMQILTPRMINRYPNRIINIHHSFLPAFPGARPYHSAHERGVKIIGATSHYVTSELDAGPIIDQDVVHVSHRDSVADLIRRGRDLEKLVLSRAIWHHLQHHILVSDDRTVIFG